MTKRSWRPMIMPDRRSFLKHAIRRIVIVSGALLIVSAAVSCKESKQVEQLRWLYTAVPEEAFHDDLKSGSLRFFVVYGYASEILGVGKLQHERCYPKIELTPIEGTSDAIESDEHMKLNLRARDFTRAYNLLMREHLDRSGRTTCP